MIGRPVILGSLLVACAAVPALLLGPPERSGRGTLLGVRPFAADVLWMNALHAGGRFEDYSLRLTGDERRAQAIGARCLTALRLAPDLPDRAWDGALLLSILGDTEGAASLVGAARAAMPEEAWLAVAEGAWLKWGSEGDTELAALRLRENWRQGLELPETVKRLTIVLLRKTGRSGESHEMLDRYSREARLPDSFEWIEKERTVLKSAGENR